MPDAFSPSVVASAFYNFNPALITFGWSEALSTGLDETEAGRARAVYLLGMIRYGYPAQNLTLPATTNRCQTACE